MFGVCVLCTWGPPATLHTRHSFTSRLLFTCISSKLFDGEKTLRDLNDEFAKQLRSMFFEGVQVPCVYSLWGHATKILTSVMSHPHEPRHSEGGQPCYPADLDRDKRGLAVSSQSTLANKALLDCRMSHIYSPYGLAASK